MHAIIEAHPVADRERQSVGVAVAVGRVQDLGIVADLAGPAPLGTNGSPDLARVGICRRRDRQLERGIGAVGLEPLTPQPGHALHRRLPAAGHQFGGPVPLLDFQRFRRPSGAEQAGDFALALGLLADRGQDLGNGLFANRLAQQVDDRPGLDRLALLRIADHDDLHAGSLLQPQQIEHLAGAKQPDLVDDHDAVAVEHVPPGLDAFQKGRDRGALGDAGRFEIGRLAPGQGDAEHLAPVGFPGLHQRGQGGALAGAGDADRDTQPAAGWRALVIIARCARHCSAAGSIVGLRSRKVCAARSICAAGRAADESSEAVLASRINSRSWSTCSAVVTFQRSLPRSGAPLPHSSATCSAVLHHTTLAEAVDHGVDVIAGPFADTGDDQCPRRDLAQFLAVQYGTAARAPLRAMAGPRGRRLRAAVRPPARA